MLETAARGDMRGRPYRERRALLLEVLDEVGPPIQAVPATTDRELAVRWWHDLRVAGIEGVLWPEFPTAHLTDAQLPAMQPRGGER